jgi:hypothetical protein
MKKTIVLLTLLTFFACNDSNDEKKNTVDSAVAASDMTEEERLKELERIAKEESEKAATTTSMTFDKMIIDFGKIKEDTEHKASYTVRNTGKVPLIIEKVDVSCGCTTAKKPEKPILPGGTDKIEIVFHPKVGQLDKQEKTVTITANTEPSTEVLTIKAFVIEK